MALRQDQSLHDRMVQAAAEHFGAIEVYADLSGYTRPEVLRWNGQASGHIPDVQTSKYIIEVETADSIAGQHAEDQWKLFAAYARENGLEFWVGVPPGCSGAAKRRLQQLGLTGQVWEIDA